MWCRRIDSKTRTPGATLRRGAALAALALVVTGCVSGPAPKQSYEDVYYQRCLGGPGWDRPTYCDR
jgi:hypothetical protein